MTDSKEVDIRCRSCGQQIAHANATIRADSDGAGERIRSQAAWMLGRLQCAACSAKEGKK